ncbi:MAG: phage tail fiber protein [Candidatus Nanoarchaeia archaeon]
MAGWTNYLEAKILDHLFGGSTFSQPADLWIGLSTSDPSDDAGTGFTEPSGNGYARVQIPNQSGDGNWNAASGGSKTNASSFSFNEATGSWGTIVAFGIFDQSTSGNLLLWGELTVDKTISSGNILRFPAGDLSLTLD